MGARINRSTDDSGRADLAALPRMLDRVDALIEEGTIGGEEPNAADFQIGATTRLLMNFDDVRPAIEGRPAADHATRLFPGVPGPRPAAVPGGLARPAAALGCNLTPVPSGPRRSVRLQTHGSRNATSPPARLRCTATSSDRRPGRRRRDRRPPRRRGARPRRDRDRRDRDRRARARPRADRRERRVREDRVREGLQERRGRVRRARQAGGRGARREARRRVRPR